MTATDSPERYALTGRLITPGRDIPRGVVAVEGDRIAFTGDEHEFTFFDESDTFELRQSPEGTIIIPGLIDLHCHGAGGGDFPSGDPESIATAIEYLHRSGTTTFLASLVTAPRADMLAAAAVLAEFAQRGDIAGIHAEGPFLSAARCGAQDPEHLIDPDPEFVDELIDAAAGQLRTMTYAPERPGSDALLEQLVSQGVVPSLGHTDADADTTSASLAVAREELSSAGVDGFTERPTVTHMFNGMAPMHHRAPGAVATCLELAARGKIIVELVADGVHLDPVMVRTMFKLVGAESIALVTDSMAATGLEDGSYRLGPSTVTVANGQARLASDGSLAGGTASMLEVVRSAVAAGVDLQDAVISATRVPASILGLIDEAGRLHQGFVADMLVLDAGLALQQVVRNGKNLL
ncbi:N-acetylglucosamine-6-phosphate deacetylase [Paeniglutamicibacter sulfureus]|uniref:N-acetylglucosamine-6-phosphate deacetylase n=1 Tax=Paeniglutamicibacter sulfureus TaxID=43666 RepID=A0ABU2BPL0_9MICC|nr:N-acetylglucosamine-6-phosphate deacetylase [Paeniglutamicibacter sulfureus]MDR7360206.1 N-acetylglucosamine-6-phosphate deacetylase [Paeniglutamicibacter sulfureus]